MATNESTGAGTPVVLGGRSFRVIDFDKRTVAADHYLAKLIRESGADKVMPMDGEGDALYVMRMQTLLIDSGKVPAMIAGMLVPDGMGEKDWTRKVAEATAKHIEQCNEPEDRELVNDLAMQVVFGFFKQGLAWLTRSLSSFRRKGLLVDDNAEASPAELSKTS